MKLYKTKKDAMFVRIPIKYIIQKHVRANVKQFTNVLQIKISILKPVNASAQRKTVLLDGFKTLFAIALNNIVLHHLFLAKLVLIGIPINANAFHNCFVSLLLKAALKDNLLTQKHVHANVLAHRLNAFYQNNGIHKHALASALTENLLNALLIFLLILV